MKNVISKETRQGHRRRTLAVSLALWLSVIVTVIIALLGVIYFFINVNQAESDLSQQAQRRVEELANVLSVPTWNLDRDAIKQIVVAYQVVENVAAIRVLDDAGSALYESVTNEEGLIVETRPIVFNGNKVGAVELSMSTQQIAKLRRNILFQVVAVLAVVILTILVATWLLLQNFLGAPLAVLTQGIEGFASGDYSVRLKPLAQHELNIISDQFNAMAEQIQAREQILEQRVTDRTQALATVAEVGTATATILETDKLLQAVVDLTKERFNLYHSHIYLLDQAGENLMLTSGAGEPGRQMKAKGLSIPLDREQSLVARAARERKGVTVNDVTQAPDFLPNPLLPDTRSELAVPMIVGGNVIGVFDVQSDVVGRFTDADIDIQTTLASQIATAVQNARLYAQAETSKQEAQSLVDYASEGILVVDLETGLFAEPNGSAVKLYGLPREELVKVGPAQMSPRTQPDGRDSTEKAMERIGEAMQTGTAIFEWMHRNGQGQDFLCEIRLTRLPGAHPRVRAAVTDITERRRTEELTRQRAQQQEALNLITQKIQNTTSVEAALQVAARELGHALGMKSTLVTLDPSALAGEQNDN
ncbi:MAG: GAF domain-containing protein [Anaerolineales bacterium]|nr:GAF domain-containing protein [Anaerolineales bacterium]